jgi:mannose-6-phosphate isomerase-like protein (cupin superfamily)
VFDAVIIRFAPSGLDLTYTKVYLYFWPAGRKVGFQRNRNRSSFSSLEEVSRYLGLHRGEQEENKMKVSLLPAAVLMMIMFLSANAASLGGGVPSAVHYISNATVTSTMVKGGPIVKDPGFNILASRKVADEPEIHEHTNHVFIIVEGEAIFVTGGTLVNPKQESPVLRTGTSIDGGEVHHLSKGDVITVPAKTPHWFKEVPTGTIAFYAVNIEN